jgi:pyrroline-5-carboxylate reductase
MKLGLIGCGKMGSALLKGAIEAGAVAPGDVQVHDAFAECAEILAKETGATAAGSNGAVVKNSEAVLLCTKPQDMLDMICMLPPVGPDQLFISIAAGMTLTKLEEALGKDVRAIRVMPNTPALIGKSASAFAKGSCATPEDAEFVNALLASVGSVVEVPEKLMDAVTGLSGSGPAYVYTMIEALADGGVLTGLPRDKALQLAAQTVAGAAEMVLQTGEHPATLRDQVTSPGGTTIAGLAEIEAGGLRSTLIEAVRAATDRAAELGES